MTPEQAALFDKARDSLRAAQLLAEDGLYDFAASRAYYAMFYVAQAFLLGESLTYSRHSAVISAFGQRFAKTGRVPKEFHRYLIEGQESRNVGDYDTGPGLNKSQAREQISRARKFVRLGERLIPAAAPGGKRR